MQIYKVMWILPNKDINIMRLPYAPQILNYKIMNKIKCITWLLLLIGSVCIWYFIIKLIINL